MYNTRRWCVWKTFMLSVSKRNSCTQWHCSVAIHLPLFEKKNCTICCTQVPIVPTFVMTAHKAQGQSMKNVIIDLQSCSRTEAPYVMILRVTSLNGLLILHPFDWNKIHCQWSQDSQQEKECMDILQLQTKVNYGTLTESAATQEKLLMIRSGTEHQTNMENELDLTCAPDNNIVFIQCLQQAYVPHEACESKDMTSC